DVSVLLGPDAKPGNLVARYRGTGAGGGGRPIIVFAHLDVVPARRADWSVDPFTFLEKDGYFYGRGSTDNKAGAAMLVADFIRLKQARFKPQRDLILMLDGDEETAGSCIAWVVAKHRDLIDAEFALNTDAGGGVLRDGRRVMFVVQASEKVYATYVLEATDKGGHSSPLRRLAPDDRITLRATNTPTPSPPSPLTASIMGPIEQLVAEQFPGIPVVPVMEAGATDGLALRNAGIPTYGVSAVFEEQNDVR